MAKRKYEVKKPGAKKPLAAIIAEQFAKRGPTPFLFNPFNKTLTEKERRSAIAFWQCFYLNGILVKCIHKEEEERVHDE
jgi:hypothetical protein